MRIYCFLLLNLFLGFQFLFPQSGILDTSFGQYGDGRFKIFHPHFARNLSFNEYYNDIRFDKLSESFGQRRLILANQLYKSNFKIKGGHLLLNEPTEVWRRETIATDFTVKNDQIYVTGYTKNDQDSKAIFVAKFLAVNDHIGAIRVDLDDTFSRDGKVVFDLKGNLEEAHFIVVQNDDKIVVCGENNGQLLLVRFLPNGLLDRTFNDNGFTYIDILDDSEVKSLNILSDNSIILSGNHHNGNDYDFFILKVNSEGVPDETFGTNGIIIKDVNNMDNTGNATVVDENDNIYIGGKAYTEELYAGFSYNYSIFKYLPSGEQDLTFSRGIYDGAYTHGYSSNFRRDNEILHMEFLPHIIGDNGESYDLIYYWGSDMSEYISSTRYTVHSLDIQTLQRIENPEWFGMESNVSNGEAFVELLDAQIIPGQGSQELNNREYSLAIKRNFCDYNISKSVYTIPEQDYEECITTNEVNSNVEFYEVISKGNKLYLLNFQDHSLTDEFDNMRLFRLDSNFQLDEEFIGNGKIKNIEASR